MPSRGYRKGVSDTKEPRPHLLRCRASNATRDVLHAAAGSRSMTLSALMAEILDAFAGHHRLELPHPRGPSAGAVRELARVGNNLNQIAHEAHLMRLHLLEAEVRRCLTAVHAAIDRL